MQASAHTLGINHIQVFVRGMYDLACTDGAHAAEMVMLRGFYDDCQRETHALTDFDDLLKLAFDLAEAKRVLATSELKAAFLQSCVLLAYADGKYTAGERARVRVYAGELGVASEVLESIEHSVSDGLMQNLLNVQNVDALREVAAEMVPK
jgi:DnaJ-domain-containing protein 1